MRLLSRSLSGMSILLSWAVFGLAHLMPRDPHRWIVIGWHEGKSGELFADNAKYFFLQACRNPGIRAIWLGHDTAMCRRLRVRGYEACSVYSMRGIWHSLRAGCTVADGLLALVHWRFSGGTRFVQLWHGKGPKQVGLKSPYGRTTRHNRFVSPNFFMRSECFIATSEFTAKLIAESFGVGEEAVFVSGLPKQDVFFHDIPGSDIDVDEELIRIFREPKQYEKVILYAPTFRPDGSNPLGHMDLGRLDAFLTERNFLLVAVLHPKFARKDVGPMPGYERIRFIEPASDMNPLLPRFDALITDYSSLSVDFVLLEKPIVYFVYDVDTYEREAGLHTEFWDLLPGPRARTFEELLRALSSITLDADATARARSVLFAHPDGGSSERVVDHVLSAIRM